MGILAVLSGVLAGYAALLYLEERPIGFAAAQTTLETTQVVVAARPLEPGSALGPDDVKLVRWPADALPEGSFTDTEELLGRGLVRAVSPNQAILESELAGPGSGLGLSLSIPEGMRAVSVKVDEVVGVAGFVLPGTRVDVVSIFTPPGGARQDPVSRVILQNVPTLAAGQTTTTDEDGEPLTVTVITLMVVPEDAEKLALAATQGRIQLALRNNLDQDEVETDGARMASLMRGPRPAPAGRRASSTPSNTSATDRTIIEVYKGGVRTLIRH